MNEQTKEAIIALLNERAHPDDLVAEAPHHYASLRDSILEMELRQEIAALRSMLLDLNTFEEKFKQRCAFRQTNTEQSVPFSDMPESLSNQLYWQIAALVFVPKTMVEMLRIVVPQVKTHVIVSIPENVQRSSTQIEPVVERTSYLDALTGPPTLAAFTRCVLSGDRVFNAEDITNFPLRLHSELHGRLEREDPKLAEKLYIHNDDLRMLAADIIMLNNKGTTPKIAIEQLIIGLTLGGNSLTGSEFASKSSDDALKRFFGYFNALPGDTQKALKELQYDNKTFGSIIDNEIELGKCVETTAGWLKEMLKKNINHPVLNSPPSMTPESLKQLENKYKAGYDKDKTVLDTRKDGLLLQTLPTQLTKKAVQGITPKTPEELIVLILNFPPSFYDVLWEHMTLKKPLYQLDELAKILQTGLFNPEQRQALAYAIARHYQRFMEGSVLFWAFKTNDIVFLKAAYQAYPRQVDKSEVFLAADYPESFKFILDLLPAHKRLTMIKATNAAGSTPLHFAASSGIETLKIALALYPETERLSALRVANQYKNSVLCFIPERQCALSFKAILELLPENQRVDFMKLQYNSYPVLYRLAGSQVTISSSEDAFKDSFLPDFIKILRYLGELGKTQRFYFEIRDDANKLLIRIDQCNSFDEISKLLNDYVRDPDAPLRATLSSRLGRFADTGYGARATLT